MAAIPTRRDRYRGRVTQRSVIPTGVKSRNLSNFIFGSSVDAASTTLENSEQVVITFTLTQNSGYEISGHNYISIYVGAVASANLLPGGSAVDETDWQVIGPMYDYDEWNDSGFPAFEERVVIYVLNISAGSQTLNIRNKWKYVSPQEGV